MSITIQCPSCETALRVPQTDHGDIGEWGSRPHRINVPADDDGLTRRFLEVLARRFDNACASIDRGVFNPARIWRLYGTRACKGEPTPDRPHRMAKIMNVPDSIQVVSAEALEAIVVETGSGDPGRIAGQRGYYSPWMFGHSQRNMVCMSMGHTHGTTGKETGSDGLSADRRCATITMALPSSPSSATEPSRQAVTTTRARGPGWT